MKGKSQQNSLFSSLKLSLFQFAFTYSHQRQQQPNTTLAAYIVNALIHLFVFLGIPEIGIINFSPLFSPLVLYTLAALMVVVLAQIVVEMVKKVSVQLLLQMEIFTFVISPLLLLTTSGLMANGGLTQPLGFILMLIIVLLDRLLIQNVLYERYRLYAVGCSGSYIVGSLNHFQTLLIALSAVNQHSIELVRTTLLLAVALHTHLSHFRSIQMDNIQWKCLHSINTLHLCLSFVLLMSNYSPSYLYIFVLAGLVIFLYWLSTILTLKKNNESKLSNLFMVNSGYQALADVSDRLKNLLMSSGGRNIELHNFLITIISEHNRKCNLTNCELSSRSVREELENKVNRNSKFLTLMVMKKIDELMEIFHQKEIQNLDITFNYLRFLAYSYKNRARLQKHISEASLYPLTLRQEYLLFSYQKICNSFDSSEAIDSVTHDEEFIQFQKTMASALSLMQQFWQQFYEQKVDLLKIRSIADKMFPFTAKLQQTHKNALTGGKYSSYKILILYTLYVRMILYQEEQALKLEDYLLVMLEQLKDTQQTKCQSNDSEKGVIVISLSDTKLGSIFLMNRLACHLFKYSKEEILGRNVSNIMPRVFGQKHDAILTDFLKKKRKKFNTDQRLLFGLDANEMLFPLQLQLQKASFSANDEFIFIAIVKTQKLRESPYYCIVDQHGIIQEHTGAFRNTFFPKYTKEKKRCIQEVIPTYFQEQNDHATPLKIVFDIQNQKLGSIQATFDIFPLVVKGQFLGQLISMTYKKQQMLSGVPYNNRQLTKVLKRMQIDDQLQNYNNSYNPHMNRFEIDKNMQTLQAFKNSLNFTLPFLKYGDLSSIVQQDKKQLYGTDIKTIRFINGHFQRIDDLSSFHSEVYSDKGNVNIQAKIAQMKSTSGKGSNKISSYSYFKIMSVLLLIVLVLLFLIQLILQKLPAEESALLANYAIQRQVRFYLPQFITYASLYRRNIDPTVYLAKADTIANTFLPTLSGAPLNQTQKQSVMRIVSSLADAGSTVNLQRDIYMSKVEEQPVISYVVLWSALLVLCVLMMMFLYCTLRMFKKSLLQVYTVFLSLKQPTVRKIHQTCRAMLAHINSSQHAVTNGQDLLSLPKNEDDQNELQKVKHFRVTNSFQDSSYYLKMILPLVSLMGCALVLMIIGTQRINYYNTLKQQHRGIFEILPATSSQLMKKVYLLTQNQSIQINTRFNFYQQKIQNSLIHMQTYSSSQDYLTTLYGNLCLDANLIPLNLSASCQLIQNGVLTHGIAPTINYLSEKYNHLSIQTVQDQTALSSLVDLQYTYVIPVLLKTVLAVERMIVGKIESQCATLNKLVIVLMVLFAGYYLYLLLYPVRIMDLEIVQTNRMITLIPKEQSPQNSSFS